MKNNTLNKLFWSFQSLFICLFLSCESESISYSCNKDVNTWVTTNRNALQTIDNSTFLSMKPDYQRAVYRVFTAEKRKKIWIDKFEEALKVVDWSEQEKKHLEDLIFECNAYSEIFSSDGVEEKKDEFKVWAYNWCKQGVEQLGWTPELIRNLLGTPHKILNKNGDIETLNNVKTLRGDPVPPREEPPVSPGECNCSARDHPNGEGFIWYDCEMGCIDKAECSSSSFGCGLLMMDRCNGRCF